jgi:hypothetical protein
MTDKTFTFAAGPEEWTANNEDTSHNTGPMCSGNGYWISSTATWNPITSQYEIKCDIKSTHRFSGTWLHVYTGENGGVQYLTFVNRVRSLIYYADDPSGPWTLLTWPNFSADCDGNSFLISDYPQKYWRIVAMTENSTADVCATLSQIVMTDFVDHDALGGGDAYHIARTPNAGETWQSVEQAWGTAHCASLKPVGNEIVAIKQDTIANTSSLWQGASTLTQKSNLPFGLATPDAMAISSQGLIAVGANEAQEGEMILVSGDGVNWATPEGAKYHGLTNEITSIRWLKPCAINYGRPTGGIQVPTDTGEVIEIPAGNPGEVLLPPSAPGQPPAWGRLNLDDLGDVDTTTTPPQDGDGLVYDQATGQWVPTQVAASVDWADVENKPTTFPPETHGHAWGEISNPPTIPYNLDDLANVIAHTPAPGQALIWSDDDFAWINGSPAPAGHSHPWGEVTGVPTASTTAQGIIELATAAEVQAGTDAVRAVTPDTLKACTATAARLGVIELATQAEVNAGTDATRAVVPSTLKGLLDGTIGRGTRVDYTGGTQAVTANVTKTISFNRAIIDNQGMWSAGAPTRLTVPAGQGGWYVIFGCAQFNPATGGSNRFLSIYHNATYIIAIQVQAPRPGGATITIAVSTIWFLAAGDFVELLYGSDVNGTIDAAWGYTPAFAAVRIR